MAIRVAQRVLGSFYGFLNRDGRLTVYTGKLRQGSRSGCTFLSLNNLLLNSSLYIWLRNVLLDKLDWRKYTAEAQAIDEVM